MPRWQLVVVVALAFTLGWLDSARGLSCFCGASPCETPTCCPSGVLTYDQCGCCQVCAKAERDPCGGPWNIEGVCSRNLQCLIKCECQAVVNNDYLACVFPFKYKGRTYTECTTADSENGKAWCAVEVDSNRVAVTGRWGDCLEHQCSINGTKCDTFNLNGRCIPTNARIGIANVNTYNIKDGLKGSDGQTIARCDGRTENKCRCDPKQEKDPKQPGQACTKSFQQDSHGWCWLENIADASNPTFNCFPDVQYSPRFGRFWSEQACRPKAPQILDFPQGPPPPVLGVPVAQPPAAPPSPPGRVPPRPLEPPAPPAPPAPPGIIFA